MKKLSIFLALFLSASAAYCQDTQVFEISSFDGGLASKLSAYGMNSNQAQISENTRYNNKVRSLSRRTNLNTYGSADATEPILGMFRHYMKNGTKVLLVNHGDEIEKGNDSTGAFTNILTVTTGDRRWQWVTWHDIAIGTDGYNQPVKYDGSSASATYLGSLLATDAGSGSGPATGAYSYKVACYSTTYTVLLNTPSNTITANGNDVSLSMIPICNDVTLNSEATTGRKIYRTESNGSTYKLLSNGTIANNTATTLTDSDADAALGAAMPAGDATWTPPKGRFLIVQNNRLFIADTPSTAPSRLYYSSDGSHDIFDTSNESGYFDIRQNDGDSITFIKGNLGLLTVGKNNTIQKVYIDGADPDADWSISDPFSYVGCQAPYSVSNSPLGIIYLGKGGLYLFNGLNSTLMSESVTPVFDDIAPSNVENSWGIYHDNFYYLSYASQTVGGSANNRVLVLDMLAKAYSIDTISINAFTAFNSGNDWGVLYSGSSTNGNVYAHSNETHEILHSTHSDFAGLWDDMRYIPTAMGGDANSPVLEIARTETIDEASGTINNAVGIIDRQDVEGHYVSQPISVSANAFDKLYWNETIPAAGGEITFKLRTSPTGESNLLLNDDFEFWDNWVTGSPLTEQPNDWTFAQDGTGGSLDEETTGANVKRGSSSLKITKSNSGQSYAYLTFSAVPYRSKTLVFNGWAKSANSVASKVRLQIADGFTTSTVNYANGGSYEELQTTIAVNASATTITVKCVVETGADAVAYFDRVMVREATTALNDWSAWSSAVTTSSGSDISGVTANTYLQYLITMTTSNIAYTPNLIRSGLFNVKLTFSREGTAQSTDIPLHWESGKLNFGTSNPKLIRAVEAFHSGSEESYTITVTNELGETDTWTVDLTQYPTHYKEYATNGAFRGKNFTIDVTNSTGTAAFSLDKLNIYFETQPQQGTE